MVPALLLIISAAALFAPQAAHAQTTNSLIQKIADTFHLNVSDVRNVFNQHREEMKTKRQERFENRLDQDVKNGKITEAQKQLILNKLQEMKTTRDKNLQSLEDWAKQNGIDPNYLLRMQIRGHGMMGK